MKISFDPEKNERNIRERSLPFGRAGELDWTGAEISKVERNGEIRFVAVGMLDGRLHTVVFLRLAKDHIRVISFRRASKKEVECYGQAKAAH